jgi:type I restriction enzyme S subunit
MREIKIPLPPFEEQRGIVGVLGVVDSVIAKTGEVIAKTERLKKGLMQTLLTRGIGHKEYKQTPIGTTPKTWEVIPCSGLCKEITVGIVVTPAKYYADSGIPCLRSFNIEENEINPKNLAYISPEANELHKKSIIHTGDVVAVRTGQPGTASVVPPAFDGANCVDLIIFRLNEKMQPHFFSWFLNSFQAKKQISAGQTGSVQQHFNIGMAKKLKVPVPPLNEQEKIVTILNSIHKKLKLEQKEKSILESIKRGLMNLLLTGKIRVKVD